jgi:hypothetical protein
VLCAGSALLLAEDESTSIIKRRPCWSVIKPVRITFSRLSLFSPDRHNLGFLTEGKLAAILIIPSSWGSQWAGHSPRIKDDKKEMGALCFTRKVRKMRVPKGFKLPHDQEKYDGSQEPTLWLSDYLQAVQILGGTRATAMQSLQLYLTGAARSRLNTLPNDSIGSWGELENQFTRNFCSTYKR